MIQHLSAFELDAAALGAVPPDAERSAHLASCATCQARAAEGQALRAQLPPELMSRTFAVLHRRRRFTVVTSVVVPLVLAAAAVLLLVDMRRADPAKVPGVAPDHAPDLAIKGGPALQVYALRDQRVFRLSDGDVLAPGDEIRFAVTPAGAGHVLIASVDGRGHATIYVPYDGERSVAIDPRARTELPGSIVLDDATGPERVFAVFSASPIRAADVWPALQRLAASGPGALRSSARLDLHVPATQASLVFEKAAR